MAIQKILEKNLFVNDIVRRVACRNYNKQILQFINEVSKIDPILDYAVFKKCLERIPGRVFGSTYTVKRAFAENTLYGYAASVMKYAGLEQESMLYLPLLEHGIDLSRELYLPRYVKSMSYIFQGANKLKRWKGRMGRDAYSIGPFIHYAEECYTKEDTENLHRKNGKTLLIFPPHADEYGGGDFIVNNFTETLQKISKEYDTVLASVFWIDTKDPYMDYLQSNGVQLVSSGFKLDSQFVSRMKTMIALSDTVLFPTLTTAIGYAYYLGKKVVCIPCDRNQASTNVEDQAFITAENNRYIQKFCKVFTKDAPVRTPQADALIDHYWGVSRIKTKNEIRKIYYRNKQQVIRRLGF